jgi:hypothetical protein
LPALLLVLALLQASCAHRPVPPTPGPPPASGVGPQPWAVVSLPGKRATRYRHERRDGRSVIRAESEASASMYKRRLVVEPEHLGRIRFSWWVPELIATADLRDRDQADSPVRLVLAFDGDHARLSPRNRMLFELAQTLSGEALPFATLMYVWDNHSALETVLPGGRTDRIRKIVVDSGAAQLGSWRLHERDIVRDFERAFGEPPGRLIGVGVMTDSDNTAARARALYGELVLIDRSGASRNLIE